MKPYTVTVFSFFSIHGIGIINREGPYAINRGKFSFSIGTGKEIDTLRGFPVISLPFRPIIFTSRAFVNLDRGKEIYAEVLGFGWASEGGMGGDTTGEAIARAVKRALMMAKLEPSDIDYINAHGNAMRDYDIAETKGFKLAFGEEIYSIPISSIKPITGQAFSATGVFQVIAACLTLKTGVIPPTINLQTPDPNCDLDYVPNRPRRARVRNILINAQNFGTHTVLIVGRVN